MPTEAPAPEPWGEDDRLAAPGVDTRTLLHLGAGFLVFVAVSLVLLMIFFRHEVGADLFPPTRTFPDPRLETNIDPRSMPNIAPGPAAPPRTFPVATPNSAQDLRRAMQIVAAKGVHAYDSPTDAGPVLTVETVQVTKTTGRRP
jgi:hypothetical protein